MKSAFTVSSRSFFSWFSKYNKKLIYPPAPHQINTKNRLFPTYIENATELGTIVLLKEPLILNFTYPGDTECNKVTQELFDVLGDASKFPLDVSKPVDLANIACDGAGGRELMQTYAVSKIPTLVLLKKQMVADKFVPNTKNVGDELVLWVKSIY